MYDEKTQKIIDGMYKEHELYRISKSPEEIKKSEGVIELTQLSRNFL